MRRSRNEFGHVSCRARATAFSAAKRRCPLQPEPAGFGIIAVGRDGAHGDATLARLADVGRRLEFASPHLDGSGGQAALQRFDAGVGIEFHPCGKAVAVEDRRLNQAQRRHGRAAALAGQVEQRGQVVFDAQLGIMERGGASSPYPATRLKASCASKTACGRVLNANRLIGLLLEFLHAGMPCSLAGAKIWMTERWMGSCAWSRRRKSARAMAPGCATTLTAEGQGLRPLPRLRPAARAGGRRGVPRRPRSGR